MLYRKPCRQRPLECVRDVLLAEEHVVPCAEFPTTESLAAPVDLKPLPC